jgi:circadian clock protein KaiB
VESASINGSAVPSRYALYLYISGVSPASTRALTNIKQICEEHLKGRYNLEVVDILQNPSNLERDRVIAVPMLIRKAPLPIRQFIGSELGDKDTLITGLAIAAS